VLRQADIVSLHAPLVAGTRYMLDRQALLAIKHSAILVNTVWIGLVDDQALLDVLREGHLAGAGLDIFEREQTPHSRMSHNRCSRFRTSSGHRTPEEAAPRAWRARI
jgi:phosphoglycerate dehydrogenase-like enzyme